MGLKTEGELVLLQDGERLLQAHGKKVRAGCRNAQEAVGLRTLGAGVRGRSTKDWRPQVQRALEDCCDRAASTARLSQGSVRARAGGSSGRSTDCSVWGEAWTEAAAAAACALRTAWGWGTAGPATAWQALKPC